MTPASRRRRAEEAAESAPPVDLCLVTASGFPYRASEDSWWAVDLLRAAAPLRCALVRVLVGKDAPEPLRVQIPENLEVLQEVSLAEPVRQPLLRTRRSLRRVLQARARRVGRAWPALLDALVAAPGWSGEPGAAVASVLAALEVLADEARASGLAGFLGRRDLARAAVAAVGRLPGSVSARASLRALVREALQLVGLAAARLPRARVYHALEDGPAGVLVALHAGQSDRSVIVTAGPPPVVEDEGGVVAAMRASARRLERALAFSQADRIVANDHEAAASACADRVGEAPVETIPFGVGIRPRRARRAAAGKIPPPVRVAFAGPLRPEGDLRTFITAARILLEEADHFEPLVLGTRGSSGAYLQDCLLRARVLLVDRLLKVNRVRSLGEALGDVDVVVSLCPGAEGAVDITDALAAGVPVVAAEGPHARDLLLGRGADDQARGAAGVLVSPGDPDALADAALRLIADPAERRSLGKIGRARVRRLYNRETSLARYRRLYLRLLA